MLRSGTLKGEHLCPADSACKGQVQCPPRSPAPTPIFLLATWHLTAFNPAERVCVRCDVMVSVCVCDTAVRYVAGAEGLTAEWQG